MLPWTLIEFGVSDKVLTISDKAAATCAIISLPGDFLCAATNAVHSDL